MDDLRRDGASAADVDLLAMLAQNLALDARRWRGLTDRLDAATARLDPQRAAAIVAETVFDEVLSPSAWRLLSACLALGDLPVP